MSKYYVDACGLLKSVRQYQKEYFDDTICKRLNIPYGFVPISAFESMIKKQFVDIDEVSRPRAEWIFHKYVDNDGWGDVTHFYFTCSNCGTKSKSNRGCYCSKCGCAMDGTDIEIMIDNMDVDGVYDER